MSDYKVSCTRRVVKVKFHPRDRPAQDSIPSSTMALIDDSPMADWRGIDLQPFRQDGTTENRYLVSSLWSLSYRTRVAFWALCFQMPLWNFPSECDDQFCDWWSRLTWTNKDETVNHAFFYIDSTRISNFLSFVKFVGLVVYLGNASASAIKISSTVNKTGTSKVGAISKA